MLPYSDSRNPWTYPLQLPPIVKPFRLSHTFCKRKQRMRLCLPLFPFTVFLFSFGRRTCLDCVRVRSFSQKLVSSAVRRLQRDVSWGTTRFNKSLTQSLGASNYKISSASRPREVNCGACGVQDSRLAKWSDMHLSSFQRYCDLKARCGPAPHVMCLFICDVAPLAALLHALTAGRGCRRFNGPNYR